MLRKCSSGERILFPATGRRGAPFASLSAFPRCTLARRRSLPEHSCCLVIFVASLSAAANFRVNSLGLVCAHRRCSSAGCAPSPSMSWLRGCFLFFALAYAAASFSFPLATLAEVHAHAGKQTSVSSRLSDLPCFAVFPLRTAVIVCVCTLYTEASSLCPCVYLESPERLGLKEF